MKISIACRTVLVAACALAALAPSQAFAAQAPGCPKKNIAYLDAQNREEDAGAKVTAAQQAYDQAKSDRAKFEQTAKAGDDLLGAFMDMRTGSGYAGVKPVAAELKKLLDATGKYDRAATADAARAEADAAQKAIDAMTDNDKGNDFAQVEQAKYLIKELRSKAEAARAATTAPDVEKRKSELDTAVSEKKDADNAVRPARDAYRECLAKANG
ncbi:hypothetical protein [Streptomyces sp. AM6-12]|uniref:hypothetical protein n=1 Tax=Streptomyces sp. AM6-12 TaxID=3345149 RepID=UPI0037A1CD69